MSCRLPRDQFTKKELLNLKDDLFLEGNESEYGEKMTIDAWGQNKENIYVPFNYHLLKYGKPNSEIKFEKTKFDFLGDFKNDDQKTVYNEAIQQLKTQKSTFLSLHTGFGKTFLAIKLAHTSKLKTGILIHRTVLADQWVESIKKFTNGKVQVIDSKTVLDPEMDYYIFNMAYVSKVWDSENRVWKRKKFSDPNLKKIGTLIVDEAHVSAAYETAKSLLYFEPKFLIALTATPKRKDGMDQLLDIYFGENKIIRIAKDPFTVYRIPTGIKPEYTTNVRGKKNWGSVISYLSNCEERNDMIVDIVKRFPDDIFMILCKLKSHCDKLSEKLKDESVTVMKGSDRKYDKTARILISTTSKLGVGFDDSRLTALILAMDLVEVEQYAGRLRHSPGKERKIFDFVDDDWSCKNHYLHRKKWYLSRNGTIINVKKQDLNPPKKRFAPKI